MTAPFVFSMAYRNLVRHPARSTLTASTVALGLAALILLWGFNEGLHGNIRDNFQGTIIGSLQVHHSGFFREPSLDRHIPDPDPVTAALEAQGVAQWTVRVESFALAAGRSHAEGVLLFGVDPGREGRVTELPAKVSRGRFLAPGDDRRCVLGAGTAAALGVDLGDTLVVVYQDRYGITAAEELEVTGVITSGEMGIDRGMVIVPLGLAQELLELEDGVTSVVARVPEERLSAVQGGMGDALGGGYDVQRWDEMFPMVREWIQLHDAFMGVFAGIVIAIVIGSVLNTVSLSMLERLREMGTLMALGTRGSSVSLTVLLESVLLSAAGTLAGLVLGAVAVTLLNHSGVDLAVILGSTTRFYVDPVIRPEMALDRVAATAAVTALATALAGVYPAWRAGRQHPARVMTDA